MGLRCLYSGTHDPRAPGFTCTLDTALGRTCPCPNVLRCSRLSSASDRPPTLDGDDAGTTAVARRTRLTGDADGVAPPVGCGAESVGLADNEMSSVAARRRLSVRGTPPGASSCTALRALATGALGVSLGRGDVVLLSPTVDNGPVRLAAREAASSCCCTCSRVHDIASSLARAAAASAAASAAACRAAACDASATSCALATALARLPASSASARASSERCCSAVCVASTRRRADSSWSTRRSSATMVDGGAAVALAFGADVVATPGVVTACAMLPCRFERA